MFKLLKILLITCLLIPAPVLMARPIKRTNYFNNYKDPLNEFGYVINVAYLRNENLLAPCLNLYYSRYLTNNFSLGICYSGIYSRDFQNSISARISFMVLNNIRFSLKPGIYIKSYIDKNQLLYFFSFESAYQFKMNDRIVLGPMFDLQMIQDNIYLIGGVQMGFFF